MKLDPLACRHPKEFAPVVKKHNRTYFLPAVIERFKKSGKLILSTRGEPKPDEIWV